MTENETTSIEIRTPEETQAWNAGYVVAIENVVAVFESKGWLHRHDQRLRLAIRAKDLEAGDMTDSLGRALPRKVQACVEYLQSAGADDAAGDLREGWFGPVPPTSTGEEEKTDGRK